jgi:hypothetical protein
LNRFKYFLLKLKSCRDVYYAISWLKRLFIQILILAINNYSYRYHIRKASQNGDDKGASTTNRTWKTSISISIAFWPSLALYCGNDSVQDSDKRWSNLLKMTRWTLDNGEAYRSGMAPKLILMRAFHNIQFLM